MSSCKQHRRIARSCRNQINTVENRTAVNLNTNTEINNNAEEGSTTTQKNYNDKYQQNLTPGKEFSNQTTTMNDIEAAITPAQYNEERNTNKKRQADSETETTSNSNHIGNAPQLSTIELELSEASYKKKQSTKRKKSEETKNNPSCRPNNP